MPKPSKPKAVEECKSCYGKGYSTRLWGGSVCVDDFGLESVYYRVPIDLELVFCKCPRGKMMVGSAAQIGQEEIKKLKLSRFSSR